MINKYRLIDAGRLGREIANLYVQPDIQYWQVASLVEHAPTIEAEPVVHAYWERYNENSDDYWKRGWRCSHCKGYHFHNGGMIKKYKRCPNCGAHMDLKEADHD